MSDERGARREAGGAKFDAAIDRAVREMLDVEPPSGLRGRVMDRIELPGPVVSAFRRKFWLVAAPVAAAAVILVAVMAPWRDAAPTVVTPATPVIAQREAPHVAPTAVAPPAVTARTPELTAAQAPKAASTNAARVMAPRSGQFVEAAAVGAVEDTNFTAVGVLAAPESIAIERLADPLPSSMRSIEPAPLQIRALEITALPETPRERREE